MSTSEPSSGPRRPESASVKAVRHHREIEQASRRLEEQRLARFRAANLDSDGERRLLAAFHPMLEQGYFIDTDETADFYDVVCDHAIARKSGLYVTGSFRVGKTTAIEMAVHQMRTDMPWLAVLVHLAKRQPNQAKASLYDDMLTSFRCPGSRYQKSADLLVRFMMAEAVLAGSRTCLLFIDEAQMFTVMHLRYLLEVGNELRKERFLLITVLVGQEELESLKMLTSEEDHRAVSSRYFVKRYALGGLHRSNDLMKYIGAFDESLKFPSPAWPYTRYFCRKAFDGGWRLQHEAERFWTALVDHSGAGERMLAYSGLRLAFVNDAIHAFLLDSMKGDSESFSGTSKSWGDAVSAAADADLFIRLDHGSH